MMKKLCFLSVLLFFVVTMSVASPVDSIVAKNLASKFWELTFGVTRGNLDNADFQNIAPDMGLSNLYVLQNANGEGFVIMPSDDIALPILGYAENGNIDVNSMPENFIGWLRGYEREIEYAKSQQIPQSVEIAAEWSALAAGQNMVPKSPTAVSPLLSTTWDQGSPYNAMCPGSSWSRAPTGCVATAMAQVMKYHAYPPKGQGSHSYTCNYYGSTLSANFGNTTYSWSSMPTSIYSSNTAVATLMYHCGVSVEMQYEPEGSGAQTMSYYADDYCAEHALPWFFGYKNSIHSESRSVQGDSQWTTMLKSELDAGRPLIYTGYDEGYTSGHCFVCDGYNSQNKFHFNWGWSGSYDGYFSISSLNLGGGSWGGGSYDYTYGQSALFGVEAPTLVVNSNFNVSPNSTSTIQHGVNHTFSVTYKNRTTNTFSGSLKLVIETESGSLVQLIQEIPSVGSISGGNTATATFSNLITAYPGSYKLVLYYKPTGSSTWINAGIGVGTNRIDVNVVLNADVYETNNNENYPYVFTPTFSSNQVTVATTGSNFHAGDSYDYYRIDLPRGYRYEVTANMYDVNSNPQQYTASVTLKVSKNGAAWSMLADTCSGTFVLEDGGPILYKVWPRSSGVVGTYLLNTQITRSMNNAIQDLNENQSLSVFPNPATDIVSVEIPSANLCVGAGLQACVYDIYGKMLFSQSMENCKASIDFSGLAAGTYVIRVIEAGRVLGATKVVKQ